MGLCCTVGLCLWAGQRTRWAQDVSEPILPASLRRAIQSSALGVRGFIMQAALLSASPHARGCDDGATPKYWPRADESARRNTLEPVLVHVCRPSEYMSVVSVISVYQIYMIYIRQLATTTFELPDLSIDCVPTGDLITRCSFTFWSSEVHKRYSFIGS